MKAVWSRTREGGQWHAFLLFEGYETLSSVCSNGMKPKPEFFDGPQTQGMEKVCRNCAFGVLAAKKRYRRLDAMEGKG